MFNVFKLFGLGGKKRQQSCLILTEDDRVVLEPLPVIKGYAVNHKTHEAWGLHSDGMVPERGTGKIVLVVSERAVAPVAIRGQGKNGLCKLGQSVSAIASESADEALAQVHKKSFRNKLADTLRLVVIIFAVTVVVIVVFSLITTGKLQIPWFSF
jgi:hypothetical protein